MSSLLLLLSLQLLLMLGPLRCHQLGLCLQLSLWFRLQSLRGRGSDRLCLATRDFQPVWSLGCTEPVGIAIER